MPGSRIQVLVITTDALSRLGLATTLRDHAQITVLPETSRQDDPDVAVLAPGWLTETVPAELWARVPDVPTVLVSDHASDQAADRTGDLTALAARRVVSVVPRHCPPAELARRVVAAAALAGADQEQTLAALRLEQRPVGPAQAELSQRELTVLRLLADGLRIEDIAGELACSERTVRNIVYGLVRRLNLRNQAHAVAYAVRTGLV
ncbi:helix-turn-helix transcriptional regulator [Actinophytocola sediminis]